MLAKMTRTEKGSPDGIKVVEYKKGEQYDLPEKLYKVFMSIGSCEDIEREVKMAPKPKNKMMETPSNKTDSLPDENQSDGEETKRRRRQ